MPQACAPRRLGVALDFDLSKTPAPVYIDTKKNNSREYRAGVKDVNNMLLGESRPTNDLDPRKWQGNGFAGHFQYVPYLGREPLRAGVKLERDIQMNTCPREEGKPLNVSQMTRSAGRLNFVRDLEEQERVAHEGAMSSMRNLRSVACTLHREEDGHRHHRNQAELNQQRQDRIHQVAEDMKGLRSAGLASINPRMGTTGSLPDLTRLRGSGGNHEWRNTAPWAQGGDWASESTWHS
eukprot:TRINITY_DN90635_c0_g1_i1.p1 TRINITY_DN90635_c0_g1~~TRINITY_DN90635_c0_g1_i1.p1  ORF type:complete len:237 (+),score=31.73 TRINITY_DN90635_c0_g1_i1:80-790(+)